MPNNTYPMSAYPLHLQHLGERMAEREYNSWLVAQIPVAPSDVEASFGKASLAGIRLHHALTDVAVVLTTDDMDRILGLTSGQLRSCILKAADRNDLAGLRPYIQAWDTLYGQQSIRFRNHVAHSHSWSENGSDVIGRIEGDARTAWTKDMLLAAATAIHTSTLLLNQIFWDVIMEEHEEKIRQDVSCHHFLAHQGGLYADLHRFMQWTEMQERAAGGSPLR